MKKFYAILSIFALCACSKELAPEKEEVSHYSETLTARIVNTKVNISDAGKFSWAEGDQIAVHRSLNGYETATLSLDGVFGVHLSDGETRDGYAIYPASAADENASDASNLAVILPNAYDVPKSGMGDYTPLPMVAVNDPASEDILFHHLGGVFRLELTNLPYETQKIAINLGKRITGSFAVEGLDSDSPFISLPDEDGEDIVYTLKSFISSSADKIILNVPVPVGSYNSLAYKIYDRFGNLMLDDEEDIAFTVERADGYEMMPNFKIDVSRIPLCLRMGDPVGEIIIKNPLLLTMEYSNDNLNWHILDVPEKAFLLQKGESLYLRGNNLTYSEADNRWGAKHTNISSKATCYVFGNIMSLITPAPDDFSQLKTLTAPYTFCGLFFDNSYGDGKIINHPSMDLLLPATTLTPYCYALMFEYSRISRMSLPATELAEYCYEDMFKSSRVSIDIDTLPAMTLSPHCYEGMFEGSAVVTSPSLPAATLNAWCYRDMYKNCHSLVNAPTLPSEVLTQGCYYSMFEGCTSLVNAPEILATTFSGDNSCSSMFKDCTSLVAAPVLPATTLSSWCYSSMFQGCTSLVNAPELPAMTLSFSCYQSMFSDCTSLVNAPALPATSLYNRCYSYMFNGCTSLLNPPELSAMDVTWSAYEYMFRGCTSLVNAPDLPATQLGSNCYEGMFSGCTSLVDAPVLPATQLGSNCYDGMFSGCTSLVDAPELLPATELHTECYKEMFSGCTSLVNAPALPATKIADRYNTESGVVEIYGRECYSGMFMGCTSLVNAPALPATTLDRACYQNMFSGCTSLVNAPDLPALVLRAECYAGMFNGCSSLKHVKAMFTSAYEDQWTTIDIPSAVNGWLTGVALDGGSFVMNEAATYSPSDIGVPSGWTVTTATE